MSYAHSAGRCANGVKCDTQADKEIACSMATLFDDANIKHSIDSAIKYQYVGFYNSFRNIYPYVHKEFKDNS